MILATVPRVSRVGAFVVVAFVDVAMTLAGELVGKPGVANVRQVFVANPGEGNGQSAATRCYCPSSGFSGLLRGLI